MEQSLLADRFHLKVHFETRDLPVYTLTIAKGGPKMSSRQARTKRLTSPAPATARTTPSPRTP